MKNSIIIGGYETKSLKYKNDENKKCQDRHFILSESNKEFFSFAVADGAGSSQYSDIGAKIVTETVCQLLINEFDSFYDYDKDPLSVKRTIILALRSSLAKVAKEMKTDTNEFASTLLFVAIKDQRLIAGHIGDGIIAWIKNNHFDILSHPENGEFLNLTFFVTSKYYLHHLRLYKGTIEDIQSLFLMTDGVANIFYSRRQKIFLPEGEEILRGLDFSNSQSLNMSIARLLTENISKRTNDDSALVVANFQLEP
jgi:serine/threonine protein phosphatase PrpC